MINLLPPAVKEERRFGRRNKQLVGFSLAVLSLAVICAGIIAFSFHSLLNEEKGVEKEIAANKTTLTDLAESQKQIDAIAKQLSTIKKLSENEVNFSEVVPKIGGIIPPGAVLSSLALTGKSDQPLQLSFKLKSQGLASVVQQNLVNSSIFESADILNVTNNETLGTETEVEEYGFTTSMVVSFEGVSKLPVKETSP